MARAFSVVQTVEHLRSVRRNALQEGKSVGFVPTMGALHQGHLALIRQAAQENDHVYVSIYVNPTQFGVNEDLASYPRTWPEDRAKLEHLANELEERNARGHIDIVWMPLTNDMYPVSPPTSKIDGDGSFVIITPLSRKLEGASRPVFFRGVGTVVMKLLNAVRPEMIYFGQKDIQQTVVIRRMVDDFLIDSQVIVAPTIREADGLAMSSRNVYLGDRRRRVALALVKALREVQAAYAAGITQRQLLYDTAMKSLSSAEHKQMRLPESERALFEVDYISIADPDNLDEVEEVPPDGAIVSGAIRMLPIEDIQTGERLGEGNDQGLVRLIDNVKIGGEKK